VGGPNQRFANWATIKRNAWEHQRQLYAKAHPVPTIPERLAAYEFRLGRFMQDVQHFPPALFLGTAKRD
jgi:hypothetical protein